MRPSVTIREKAQFAFAMMAASFVGFLLSINDESASAKALRVAFILSTFWAGLLVSRIVPSWWRDVPAPWEVVLKGKKVPPMRSRTKVAYAVVLGLLVINVLLLPFLFGVLPLNWWVWAATGSVPVWFVALGFAVVWRMEDWRPRLGHCLVCGYDLTGLDDGAVCPECGRPSTESHSTQD